MKMRFLITVLLLALLTAGCTRPKPRTEIPDIMEAAWWLGLDEAEMERPDEVRLRSALSQSLGSPPSPRNSAARKWLDSLPGPSPSKTPLPLAIAIVTEDRRPVYHEAGLALAFLPLVPYSQGSSGGTQGEVFRDPRSAYDPLMPHLNYRDLIPLFVSHGLRKSAVVCCANCEESHEVLWQYELVLTLIVREARTSTGVFLYGLSLPGDLLWLAGLPVARVAVVHDVGWSLCAVSTGKELGRGECHYRGSSFMGFYYNGTKARHIQTGLLPLIAEQIVSDVEKALRAKSSDYWATLVQEHEKWRQAKGERLTYKRH